MKKFRRTLIRNLLIIGAWELGKYLGEQLIIYANRNDDVDAPCDYDINSQADLNGVHNYNAGGK